ncbi:MAG: prepilin-type N-terminal cleavage/methylation domain-containing protein [Oligoflexus sp.]
MKANESGVSLLELLVVVAIISALTYMSSFVLEKSNQDSVIKLAAANSNQVSEQLKKIISRDISLRRSAADIVVRPDGLSLAITRPTNNALGNNNSYRVSFTTQCRPVRAFAAQYGDLNQYYQSPELNPISTCLRKANCPQNTVPFVAIRIDNLVGGGTPEYPLTSFPLPSHDKPADVIGIAACFVRSGEQLKLLIQSVHGKGEQNLGVVGKETVYSLVDEKFKIIPQ